MKRLVLLFFIFNFQLSIINTLSAQYLNKAVEIWPKEVPGGAEKKEPVWNERPNDGRAFSNVSSPTLEAFVPDSAKSNGKAVIVCPGGGYAILAYEKEGQEVAQWLAGLGYNA